MGISRVKYFAQGAKQVGGSQASWATGSKAHVSQAHGLSVLLMQYDAGASTRPTTQLTAQHDALPTGCSQISA